jgi:uncharacterized protein with PIN domain
MIVVDSSAVVAILFGEPSAPCCWQGWRSIRTG